MTNDLPLLSLLFLSLPAGALLSWLLPRESHARLVALAVALFDLVVACAAVARFDAAQPGFQLVESYAWMPSLGIRYHVGVDGLSVLFLPAAVLLFVGVIAASWNSVRTLPRLYYTLLMLLETATLGVFCALDTMLFFLFWEFTLVPLYFLVSLWGVGAHRRHAATKYTLVMLAGGVSLLFGFLVAAFNSGMSFDLPTLLAQTLPHEAQLAVFLLLLVGFGVKVPLFPLHTWLPLIAAEGPVGVTALLTGMKLGAYGLIRFAVPLAPDVARELHWLLAGLGTVSMLYGAAAALAQTDLRRMLAYASLSHVGLVVLGLASFTLQGVQGATLQLLNFVFASGGAFLVAGFLQHRCGTADAAGLGGAARTMPLLAAAFLVLGLAGMGVPGTSGFPAEFLLLLGIFKAHAGAGLAALLTMVVGAAYFVGLYRKAFLGPLTRPAVAQAQDLLPRELAITLVLCVVVLAFGFFPAPLLDLMRASAEAWMARLG
jgi:NADH-quinone oxidoreductase subunit M